MDNVIEIRESLRGSTLSNGALCLESRPSVFDGEFVVLAFRANHPIDSYVVWNADSAGNCWRGVYFKDIKEATEFWSAK